MILKIQIILVGSICELREKENKEIKEKKGKEKRV